MCFASKVIFYRTNQFEAMENEIEMFTAKKTINKHNYVNCRQYFILPV